MRKASRKPLVINKTVRSPFRSNNALVATVVPILIAAICSMGIAALGESPKISRIP